MFQECAATQCAAPGPCKRPTSSGERAVKSYRKEVADAVLAIYEEEETFSTASALLREKVQSSGGEEAAEVVVLQAIEEGIAG